MDSLDHDPPRLWSEYQKIQDRGHPGDGEGDPCRLVCDQGQWSGGWDGDDGQEEQCRLAKKIDGEKAFLERGEG